VVRSLLATRPPCPSVLPPIPDDEPKKVLKADENRAEKGENGYLGGLDGQLHAATVRRHDDGDGAAIGLVRDGHGSRSLRGRSLKAQPDECGALTAMVPAASRNVTIVGGGTDP
jgi:hypothetical protein